MIRVEPGPWHVDNERVGRGIVNEQTGRTKYIGRVSARGTNCFDRAVSECERRNGVERDRAISLHSDRRIHTSSTAETGR